AAVVETEAQQHVGVLQLAQLRALEQILVLLDRAADLPLLAIEIAEDQVNLERIAGGARRFRQLLDRLVDLVRDEEVQPQHVMRRLARTASVDPHAVPQLVAFPRLADRQADEQGDEPDEQRGGGGHQERDSAIPAPRPPRPRRGRPAPPPPAHPPPPLGLPHGTAARTSAAASAGAAEKPARRSTGRSCRSSPM